MALIIVWKDLFINSIIQAFSLEKALETRAGRNWVLPQRSTRILEVVSEQQMGSEKKKGKTRLKYYPLGLNNGLAVV